MKKNSLFHIFLSLVLGTGVAFASRTNSTEVIKIGPNKYLDKATFFDNHPTAQCILSTPGKFCAYRTKLNASLPYDDSEVEPILVEGSGLKLIW